MDDYMFIKRFCLVFGVDQELVNELKHSGKLPGKKDEKDRFLVDVGAALDVINQYTHTSTMYTRKQLVQELRLLKEDWAEQAATMLERDIYNIEDLRNRYEGQKKRAKQYKELYEQAKKFSASTQR